MNSTHTKKREGPEGKKLSRVNFYLKNKQKTNKRKLRNSRGVKKMSEG